MRWGACDWETVKRTDKEPLETGRKAVRRLREGPRGHGCKEGASGKGRVPKSWGRGDEGKSLGWTEDSGSRHSPEPRGRQDWGRRTAADAGRASSLKVRTGEAPVAAASQPEEGRERVRASEVGYQGQLQLKTTGSAPTAGKDGNAEGPRLPRPPAAERGWRGGQGPRLRKRDFPETRRDFRTARARPRLTTYPTPCLTRAESPG